MRNFELAVFTASQYNILPLTSKCNLRCLFCSHPQNPPGVKAETIYPLTLEEIDELLNYLNGSEKIIIGESATRLIEGEPLTHPDFIKVLKKIRTRFPRAKIAVTTNGTLLTPEIVKDLAVCKPLEINLSLNSSSAKGRIKLMGDNRPNVALNAPVLLQQSGITYNGSLVAVPEVVGWEDIRNTVLYLAGNGARTVRIFLPGYTKLFPKEKIPGSELRTHMEFELEKLRLKTRVPLLLEPPGVNKLEPVIEGVIPGSPADSAGLKRGDIILRVNGRYPRSRVEAFRMVSRKGKRVITVCRNNREQSFTVNVGNDGCGITFYWDFDFNALDYLNKLTRQYKVKKGLILTSELALEIIKKVVTLLHSCYEIEAVPNSFFGGNICCAGLLTIKDFQEILDKKLTNNNAEFDLVIVPKIAFDHKGNDLTGENYRQLQHLYKIPVEPV